MSVTALADGKVSDDNRRILTYWLMLRGRIVLLVFLNWQLKRAGFW